MFGGRNRNIHPGIMILVAITAPLAAFLLQMAVSRSKYHADATAAKLTNKPWALISALKKLEWKITGSHWTVVLQAMQQCA